MLYVEKPSKDLTYRYICVLCSALAMCCYFQFKFYELTVSRFTTNEHYFHETAVDTQHKLHTTLDRRTKKYFVIHECSCNSILLAVHFALPFSHYHFRCESGEASISQRRNAAPLINFTGVALLRLCF